MNLEHLAAFVATCNDAERRELAATVRAGMHELRPARRLNGTEYDATAPRAVLAALASARGNDRCHTGPITLTVEAVSSRAQVTSRTVRNWIRSGRLPATKAGRDWLIRTDNLDRVLQERTRR